MTFVNVDGLLYAVTGPTGTLPSQGYSIDISEDGRYKSDIIATWEPDEQVRMRSGN